MEGQALERWLPPNRCTSLECQARGFALVLCNGGVPVYCKNLPQRSAKRSAKVIKAIVALAELAVQSGPGNESALTWRYTAQTLCQPRVDIKRHSAVR